MTNKKLEPADAPQTIADGDLDQASGGIIAVLIGAKAAPIGDGKESLQTSLRGTTASPTGDSTVDADGRSIPAAF